MSKTISCQEQQQTALLAGFANEGAELYYLSAQKG